MRAKEFIVETAMMGKIADSGKIIRILKKAHTVPFSDEKNWLLVDTDPGKGNSGLGIKWISADTRFEWVRPYRDSIDENFNDDAAEEYRAHLIKTLPKMMKLFANIGKGWIPSKEQMLNAVDTAYVVMKHTGDVKQAGKVLMDELNALYRMSKGKQDVAEGATVTRIDSNPITDFGSSLKAYKHTDDWSQSGLDTGDDSYWKNKNLKTNTTKGLFAGDPRRTALYATGNAYETRYVEFTQNGQPIVYFDQKDLPAMRSRKTYLTVFDASDFRQLPTGEWFSENPSKPIKQVPIGDPFKYIADQGWIVRVTDDLDKVFKQVKNMHKAGKIAHYGAEGMNESKQGVAEEINSDVFNPAFNDTQIFDELTYRATAEEVNDKTYFQVKVLDSNFQQVGLAKFSPTKRGLVSAMTWVHPEYQGQGLARNIYAYVRSLGNTIAPSRNQLPAGKAMWDSWKKSGDAKYLMRDVAEGSLGTVLPWPEVVNKVNSAMKAMGWKGQRKADGSFMFSTKGQLDDEFYIVIIDNEGNSMFTYALGTVEEGTLHIGEQDTLPTTEASVSELMNAIQDGFGLNENFADGRNPEDKGDSKRHGINTRASVSSLRKTAKSGGRKGQLAHWLANMKSGRAKAKSKNETIEQGLKSLTESEPVTQDYMAGHCHVMAIALKMLHPDWQIRAHVGWDDDAADDTEYRVDHVYTVAPDGSAYDCRGRFDSEEALVGQDATGGVETQYADVDLQDIKQLVQRGELKRFTRQDIDSAMRFAKQIGQQGVAEEMQHKKITELFDAETAFSLQWDNQFAGRGEVHAEAYDADGRTIDISFTPTGYGRGIEIVFKRGGSYDLTGQGDASRVLATVVNAISQYLQKYQPPYIAFSAKSTGGRVGAYTAMIKRLARGYTLLDPVEYPEEVMDFLDFLGSDKPFILVRS